jgi:hypothetical protein
MPDIEKLLEESTKEYNQTLRDLHNMGITPMQLCKAISGGNKAWEKRYRPAFDRAFKKGVATPPDEVLGKLVRNFYYKKLRELCIN